MLYLRIDQHSKQLTVNVRNEAGQIVLRKQVSTRGDAPREFLLQLAAQAGPRRLRGHRRSLRLQRGPGETITHNDSRSERSSSTRSPRLGPGVQFEVARGAQSTST